MNILKIIEESLIDYNAVKKSCQAEIVSPMDFYDLSVIIPVRRREEYTPMVVEYLTYAANCCKYKISITVVEHDDTPRHRDIRKKFPNVNYIFIPSNGDAFNKCLAHNIGALYMQDSDDYLFHDTDIICWPDFFNLLFENLKNYEVVQAFTGRRLLQASQDITECLMKHTINLMRFPQHGNGLKQLVPGASGGSICVDRNVFFDVGGFDPELFTEYSIEDQFFFDKLHLIKEIGFADDPPIEQLHLWHRPSYDRTTKQFDSDCLDAFRALSNEDKHRLLQIKGDHLKKYLTW